MTSRHESEAMGMALIDCLAAGDTVVKTLATELAELDLQVIVARTRDGGSTQDVVAAATDVLSRLAALERVSPHADVPVAVVVSDTAGGVAHAALTQAVRGIVQSVVEERLHHVRRCNVVTHLGEASSDLVRTLRFLDSAPGRYMTGAWIDLGMAA